MFITLSPSRMNESLNAIVNHDIIIINGVEIDFSPLTHDDILPATAINSVWIAGDVRRVNNEIHLALFVPHGANAPYETRYPAALVEPLHIISGPVPLPPYDAEEVA